MTLFYEDVETVTTGRLRRKPAKHPSCVQVEQMRGRGHRVERSRLLLRGEEWSAGLLSVGHISSDERPGGKAMVAEETH